MLVHSNNLPKTCGGKIMRRILNSLAKNESAGDTMTLMNPESVEQLKERAKFALLVSISCYG